MNKRNTATRKAIVVVVTIIMQIAICLATIGCVPMERTTQTSGDETSPATPSIDPATEPTQDNTPELTQPITPTTQPLHNCNYMLTAERPATCLTEGYLLYTCSCQATYKITLDVVDHHYVETNRKDPTIEESGFITMTCEYCDRTYDEELPAVQICEPHQFIILGYVPATDTQEGFAQVACIRCGVIYTASVPREEKAP